MRSARPITATIALALICAPQQSQAHGGLPIAEDILLRGETLVVPTQFWGVFLGKDGEPWRWICEEAVNKLQTRKWALGGDGTYYATDYTGVTASRDGGCTFTAATGEIALRSTSAVVADPVDPKRAYATTDAGVDKPWNALFTTADSGLTWTPVRKADEYLRGVAVSPDGKRVFVIGAPRSPAAPTDGGSSDGGAGGPLLPRLHISDDGGNTWRDRPIGFELQPGFFPTRLVPLRVDPRDPSVLWVRVQSEPVAVLLRVTVGGGDALDIVEVLRKEGTNSRPGIGGVAVDVPRDELLIATTDGVYRAKGKAAPTPIGNLSRAQCVAPKDGKVYACSWNYDPDQAAIARSDDDGATFKKVFQYAETAGPVEFCPANTPVAQVCPAIWRMYAPQLGIEPAAMDMGTGGKVGPSCAASGRRGGAAGWMAIFVVGLVAIRIGVRRRRSIRRRNPR